MNLKKKEIYEVDQALEGLKYLKYISPNLAIFSI